jgi:hypothetical protein
MTGRPSDDVFIHVDPDHIPIDLRRSRAEIGIEMQLGAATVFVGLTVEQAMSLRQDIDDALASRQ